MAVSMFGPFLFMLFPLAGSASDLVSLIDADDYFKSRQIEVKVDKLVELAGKKPEGSADRIAQLLAIRWLGEHADEVKKAKNGRETLQQLADGKLGQDPQGFAKDYAARALARLDGKKLPLAVIGDNALKDALAWFPDGVSFAYAIDVRTRLKEPILDEAAVVKALRQVMGQREKEYLYNMADTVGNLRIDGMALGMATDANDRPENIYMRFSGLGDRDLLAKYLFVQNPNSTRVEEKGPNGEPITLIETGDRGPALAIIGNSDLIVAGKERPMKDSLTIVRDVLAVRAGKQPSAVKGTLAEMVKEAPAGASALLGGKMPTELSRMLVQPRGPLSAFPKKALLSLVAGQTMDFRLTGQLATAEEAKSLGDTVTMLKQQGLAALKAPGIPLKADAIAAIEKAIKAVKAEVNGDKVQVSGQVGADTLNALTQALLQTLESSRPVPAPDN